MERPIWRLCAGAAGGRGLSPRQQRRPPPARRKWPCERCFMSGCSFTSFDFILDLELIFFRLKKRGSGAQPHIGNKQARPNFPIKQDYVACALGNRIGISTISFFIGRARYVGYPYYLAIPAQISKQKTAWRKPGGFVCAHSKSVFPAVFHTIDTFSMCSTFWNAACVWFVGAVIVAVKIFPCYHWPAA